MAGCARYFRFIVPSASKRLATSSSSDGSLHPGARTSGSGRAPSEMSLGSNPPNPPAVSPICRTNDEEKRSSCGQNHAKRRHPVVRASSEATWMSQATSKLIAPVRCPDGRFLRVIAFSGSVQIDDDCRSLSLIAYRLVIQSLGPASRPPLAPPKGFLSPRTAPPSRFDELVRSEFRVPRIAPPKRQVRPEIASRPAKSFRLADAPLTLG
jgi:hypothetical protein